MLCIHGELTLIVSATRICTLSKSLVSTAMAVASPPASLISRSTVLIVDCWEFGSGGNGSKEASLVDFAATTTINVISKTSCGSDLTLYLRNHSSQGQLRPAFQFLEKLLQ